MNELRILTEQEVLGESFKIYGTEDEPLFLAKDIAEWIEHTDLSRMINLVDEDEKLKRILYVSGQNRLMWFLTEGGLYEVLMQSRKQIAKEFKNQVKQILKKIRQEGNYQGPKDPMEIMELQFKALKQTNEEVSQVKRDVTYLKDEVKLDAGEYSFITKKINKSVAEIIKVFSLANTRDVKTTLFKDINRGVNEVAGIRTRTQLRQKHLEQVLEFVEQWTPSTAAMMKARQLTLEFDETDGEQPSN